MESEAVENEVFNFHFPQKIKKRKEIAMEIIKSTELFKMHSACFATLQDMH